LSSTGRSDVRRPNDNYPTPEWTTHRFLDRAVKTDIPLGGSIIEPSAGDGAIIEAFNSHALVSAEPRVWTACDLRVECAPALHRLARKTFIGDFLRRAELLASAGQHFSMAISNPPFAIAEEVIRASMKLADWVVMLLRVNYLGSEKRAPWLATNMPDVYVLPNRPCFVVNKAAGKRGNSTQTDSTEYGWFVWGPHSRGATRGALEVLDVTPLSVRKAHTAMLRKAA